MGAASNVQKILHAYVRRAGNPHVGYDLLDEFALRFARRFSQDQPDLVPILGDERERHLQEGLAELEKAEAVTLERSDEGALTTVYYRSFFSTEIVRWYRKMSDDKELPFPSEDHLETTLPTGLVRSVDVADNLMHFLESEEEPLTQILLLKFPAGIREVVTTVKLLQQEMLPLVIAKIRDYLRNGRNASYMETRLRSVFPKQEMLVHEQIESAQTRPDDTVKVIREPNEFQFHLWTQLSSLIIKELSEKTEKLDVEHGFCQAAYLLGYYAVFYKGRHRNEQKREETHRLLDAALQKPPYAFTAQDILSMTDDKGVPLTKRVDRDEIMRWLDDMLKRPNRETISELVTVNTPEKKGLMIHSAQYVPLLLRQVKAASPVIARGLTNEMYKVLFDERDEAWVHDDLAFDRKVEERTREEFHLLYGMANFETLFLVVDGQELPEGQEAAALSLIDSANKRMRSWTQMLQLSRESIYKEARLRLPAWMLIPIVRGIVRLFRHMFSSPEDRRARKQAASGTTQASSPSGSEPGSAAAREAKKKQFRESLEIMQQAYLDAGETPDQKLKKLRQQWNPLLDPVAADNLVEDVNSLCRDTLRRMRYTKTLAAPDAQRIAELATRIAGNSAFQRINRRKAFESYLKLYMLTLLSRSV